MAAIRKCKSSFVVTSGYKVVVALLGAAFWATEATAAPVTFSAVGSIANNSTGSEIDNTGAYQFAWNVGKGASSAVTVNGVAFSASNTNGVLTVTENAADGAAGRAFGSAYGPDMFTLMDNAVFSENGVANNSFAVTLSGLTATTPYRVQFLMGDTGVPTDRSLRITSGAASTGDFQTAVTSRFVFATFTADSTTQSFNFLPTNANENGDRAILNGVAVFAVPEPTAAMSLLGLGGLALRRRTR